MFVQIIQGRTTDAAALRRQFEAWDRELKPAAEGFLGSTAGVTADGDVIALVRFHDEESARANSARAQQDAWWAETSQHIASAEFTDCPVVDLHDGGGSDAAGFVQVILGRATDVAKARDIDASMRDRLPDLRPDIVGSYIAWHPDDGRFFNVIYFTSEEEARANERAMEDEPEFTRAMEELQAVSTGEPAFLDLSDPWYSSP